MMDTTFKDVPDVGNEDLVAAYKSEMDALTSQKSSVSTDLDSFRKNVLGDFASLSGSHS